MTSFAVIRPGRTLNRDPLPVVLAEYDTIQGARAIAVSSAETWGHVWIEEWGDAPGGRLQKAKILERFHCRKVMA